VSDPLHEILRSPLDDLPEPRLSTSEVVVLGAALILGVTVGWFVGAPGAESATSTTTTVAALPEPLDLPEGWVDTGAGYAAGVSWMYTRGPDLVVGVSVANPAGSDPIVVGQTALGFDRRGLGIWTVELSGGERISHTREMFDLSAPGVVTIEFADIGATTDDVRGITLRPAEGFGTRVHQLTLPVTGLPARFDAIEPLEATERVVPSEDGSERTDLTWVTLDVTSIDWSNAAVEWSMEEADDVRIMVQVAISLEGDTDEPVLLQTQTGGGAFLQRSFPPLSPATTGITVLRKVGGATRETYAPSRANLTVNISWLRYGDAEVDLDLTGVTLFVPLD